MNLTRSNIFRTLLWLLVIGTLMACVLTWWALSNKRSVPGRVLRFFRGEGGCVQIVNDLNEDIRTRPELGQIQDWGVRTLAKFRSGEIQTNGQASYWSPGKVRLADEEMPDFVKQWAKTHRYERLPELSIVATTNGEAECIAICWYEYGIVVGPPEYRLSFWSRFNTQIKPGVFAYHFCSK